jgi:hypothetical protein
MSEALSWFLTLFDAFISSIYTTYNFIVKYWANIFVYIFLFIVILYAWRTGRSIKKRYNFSKTVKAACEENGGTYEELNNIYLSLLFNRSGYDIKVTHNDTVYRIKFYPGFISKRIIHVDNAKESHAPLFKWWGVLRMKGGHVAGRLKKLDYDNEVLPNTVNILLFSPDPFAVTETFINGEIWERDVEYGDIFDGVYIYTDTSLSNQLLRVLEGYIPSLTSQKRKDLE